MMKLYDYASAPNPRRVRIFLAEKGEAAAAAVEVVNVDILQGQHKTPEFFAKNINGQIPVLELDDGTCLSESVAICRYLESLFPTPALFGADALAQAQVEMHQRRIELALGRFIGTSWVNGPVVAKAAPGRFQQIAEAKTQADNYTHAYYKRLDGELAERNMIAGEQFSIADITTLCLIDFASQMVGLPPAEDLQHLKRWHSEVSARPSAQA